MIKVALTGNIGSGKSTVVHIFSTLGVPVFYADKEAKLLYNDDNIKKAVREYFGDIVFDQYHEVDFNLLASKIFSDESALRKINEIIHPGVFRRYASWAEQNSDVAYTLHEAAIVFENHLEGHFDAVINVSAPEHIRMERVIKRDGVSTDQFFARAKNQWPEEEKNKKSDFIIVNDGKHFLIPQVMEIHHKLYAISEDKV
jgi:dephospho-CoA kinase